MGGGGNETPEAEDEREGRITSKRDARETSPLFGFWVSWDEPGLPTPPHPERLRTRHKNKLEKA